MTSRRRPDGSRIKALRQAQFMSTAALGAKVGLAGKTISNIESPSGTSTGIAPEKLHHLAHILGVSIDEIAPFEPRQQSAA